MPREIIRDVVQPLGEHNPEQLCVRTECVSDLVKYNFTHFNPMQSNVVDVLEQDCNVIIASPTASGKTIAMELFTAHALQQGKHSLCLFPLKALTEEKLDDWRDPSHTFSSKKIIPITSDYVLTPEMKDELYEADIIVATSEMLDSKTRTYTSNAWLNQIGVLVVDEAHLIGSDARGPRLESAIMRFCKYNTSARIILMSATVPNKSDLVEWIYNITGRKTVLVESDYRPCILNKHYIKFEDGLFSSRSHYEKIERLKMNVVKKQIDKNADDQHLVFVGNKYWGYEFKKFLCALGYNAEFHNADFSKDQRREIEKKFRLGEIRYLISTSTLSWGCHKFGSKVNMADGSLKNIEDIIPGDMVVSFDGILYNKNKVLKIGTKNVDKSLKITLSSGEFCEVSKDHLFYSSINREGPNWCESNLLKIGDYISVPTNIANNDDKYIFSNIGYLIGYVMGDGCLVNCGFHADGVSKVFLDICGSNEDIEYFKSLREMLCNEFNYNIPNIIYDMNGTPHIVCKSKKVSNQFIDYMPISDSKDKIIIPDTVFNDRNILKSLIIGLFDSDGSVYSHGGDGFSVEFTSISEALVRQVQNILLTFGIRSSVSNKIMKDRIINGRFQPAVRKHIWRIRIYNRQACNFYENIGFRLPRKSNLLKYLCDKYLQKKYNSRKDVVPVRNLLFNEILKIDNNITRGCFENKFKIDLWNIENRNEISRYKIKEIIEYYGIKDENNILYKLCNSNTTWKKIVSIEECPGGCFQDIEVENDHTYICDGFISHNCNLPARRVILAHTSYGLSPMEICDIEQSEGRSGRPKYDKEGDAYIVVSSSQFEKEKERLEGGFKIQSKICTVPNLAFNAVSEVMAGTITTKDDFYDWYKHTLAYIQDTKLTKDDCDSVFSLLVDKKMIERTADVEEVYEVTQLGKIASVMYFNPLDLYDWFVNFSKLDRLNPQVHFSKNDIKKININVCYGLANSYEFRKNRPYISKNELNTSNVSDFMNASGKKADGVCKIAACYYALINGYDVDMPLKSISEQLKFDLKRVLATLKMVHERYAKNIEGLKGYKYSSHEWDILYYRILYGVDVELCPLVAINGIGREYSKRLYSNGIKNKDDLVKKDQISKSILGEKRFKSIIDKL